jgi:hypothetical protein
MTMLFFAQALATAAFLEAPARPLHFDVTAAYESRRPGAGEVAVRFVAKDPDVKINEHPAPKLKLESGPLALVPPPAPRAAAAKPAPGEPGHYLDLTLPVAFPVTVAPGTSPGEHAARGTITYFYCSKREGWCRKGTAPVSVTVAVR